MDQRKQRSGNQRERGDGFGAARNRAPPLGLDDAQNRRDERAGVADANPEDERRDVEAPERWPVLARHADAHRELEEPRDEHDARHRDQQAEDDVVLRACLEERTQQIVVDLRFGWMKRRVSRRHVTRPPL